MYHFTLYAYEDGKDSKFRNVGTKSSEAGRLPKRHNTAFNHGESSKLRSQMLPVTLWFILSHPVTQARSIPLPVLLRSQPNIIIGTQVENGTSNSRVSTTGPRRSVPGRTVLLFFSITALLTDHTCTEDTKKCC